MHVLIEGDFKGRNLSSLQYSTSWPILFQGDKPIQLRSDKVTQNPHPEESP